MRRFYIPSILLLLASPALAFSQQSVRPDSTQQAAWDAFKSSEGEDWRIIWGDRTGVPRAIYNGLSQARTGQPEEIARSFLLQHGTLFNAGRGFSDLRHVGTRLNRGVHHIIFRQTYEDIPVEGAEYKVHVRTDGQIDMINGTYYPRIEAPTQPSITSSAASRIAVSDLGAVAVVDLTSSTELVIFPMDEEFKLAWSVILFSESPMLDWQYWVDAISGEVLLRYNRVTDVTGTGYAYPSTPDSSSVTSFNLYRLSGNGYLQGTYAYIINDVSSEAYSANHTFQYATSNTHFDEVNLYYHVDRFRHDFVENLGNSGFNQIYAHAHANYSPGPNNAWFLRSNQQLYFGDGTGAGFNDFAREEKVVYHEYSHAVIYDINSGILSTSNEEGAISEGIPDYFAGSFTGRNLILEYAAYDFRRDMENPTIASYAAYEASQKKPHDGGEFFSAILWDLRSGGGISSAQTDFLVYDTLYRITGDPNFLTFLTGMIAADYAAYSGAHASLIEDTFAYWGIELPDPPSAPTWAEVGTYDPYEEIVYLGWDRNPTEENVDYYRLYRATELEEFYLVDTIAEPGSGSVVEFEDDVSEFGEAEYFYYQVRAHNSEGWGYSSETLTVEKTQGGQVSPFGGEALRFPTELTLEPNFPNPFNPTTQIRFGLPSSSHVQLQILNTRGQLVRSILEESRPPGWYTVTWDGKNDGGREVASGIYLYVLEVEGKRLLKKLLLIR